MRWCSEGQIYGSLDITFLNAHLKSVGHHLHIKFNILSCAFHSIQLDFPKDLPEGKGKGKTSVCMSFTCSHLHS